MNKYILDANTLIEPARKYYSFDIAPMFWETLIKLAQDGQILSIDHVQEELQKGNDKLKEWAKNQFSSAFASTDDQDIRSFYTEIIRWADNQVQYEEAAKQEFAAVADGWVVAYARVHACTVVTFEKRDPNIKRKIRIPNVCDAFGVECIDLFQMLRRLGVRWTG